MAFHRRWRALLLGKAKCDAGHHRQRWRPGRRRGDDQTTDFVFYARGCGDWVMLDTNNMPALSADKPAPKKDGVYIIGLNMAPGKWRSNGAGEKCYWE